MLLKGYYALIRLLQHNLQIAMVELALQNEDLIVPGYTHLQRAQPVLLQHLLLAYVEQVSRIWLTSLINVLYLTYHFFYIILLVMSSQLGHTWTIVPGSCYLLPTLVHHFIIT